MTMNQPSIPTSDRDPTAHKTGLVMIGLFAVGCVLFVCGGGLALGVSAANNSERDAVKLSYFILSPMGAAIIGLVASVITHFAIKKSAVAKVIIPLVMAFFTVPCVLGCMVFFYQSIWPSL